MSETLKAVSLMGKRKARRESEFSAMLKRLWGNSSAAFGLALFLFLVLISILAPLIAPYDYTEMDLLNKFQLPSSRHWFGTDELGRDIFSRILYGGRFSLSISVLAVGFAMMMGLAIGSVAGYFGGRIDNLIMRFLDIIQSIPGILLTIAISAALGAGFDKTIIALSISHIPALARVLRASMMRVRKDEYMEAAESIGCGKIRQITRYLLPNSYAPMLVTITMMIASTVLETAALSYIGLGVQPPAPEWGALLSSAKNYMRYYPHTLIFPGIFIAMTVLSLNLFGDGLRDALDPRLKD
ncbi:MAG: ABC transporter permease [Clostridiales bacterium]|jgi:peptide/nickel transport system permease protein|nr:ABC transporter permease [Clostridiales bacterium]